MKGIECNEENLQAQCKAYARVLMWERAGYIPGTNQKCTVVGTQRKWEVGEVRLEMGMGTMQGMWLQGRSSQRW